MLYKENAPPYTGRSPSSSSSFINTIKDTDDRILFNCRRVSWKTNFVSDSSLHATLLVPLLWNKSPFYRIVYTCVCVLCLCVGGVSIHKEWNIHNGNKQHSMTTKKNGNTTAQASNILKNVRIHFVGGNSANREKNCFLTLTLFLAILSDAWYSTTNYILHSDWSKATANSLYIMRFCWFRLKLKHKYNFMSCTLYLLTNCCSRKYNFNFLGQFAFFCCQYWI